MIDQYCQNKIHTHGLHRMGMQLEEFCKLLNRYFGTSEGDTWYQSVGWLNLRRLTVMGYRCVRACGAFQCSRSVAIFSLLSHRCHLLPLYFFGGCLCFNERGPPAVARMKVFADSRLSSCSGLILKDPHLCEWTAQGGCSNAVVFLILDLALVRELFWLSAWNLPG